MMKVFLAALGHETSPLSPIPTNLDSFREGILIRPSQGDSFEHLQDGDHLGGHAIRNGHDVTLGVAAFAQPSRPLGRQDYGVLREELLSNLRAALPIDMVVMFLHGAQMAEGEDDCEGDIIKAVRQIVGPNTPIGVEMDLHGNISDRMVEHSDILMACKEYPHIDFGDRAKDLLALMEQTVRGEIKPTMAMARIPMLGSYFTTREPMRSFVDELMSREGKDGVLSISIGHGFAWADSPLAGGRVLVVTDNDKAKAITLASELAEQLFAMREDLLAPTVDVQEAIDRAIACPNGPVVIADITDNPGGGAPGDATHILKALVDRGIENAALAMIWDPIAAQFAKKAGFGSTLPLRIGGKSGALSGQPVDLEVTVTAIEEQATQMAQGSADPLGLAVAVRSGGIDIVINSIRQQTWSPECFTKLGIVPTERKVLVVKSNQHFHETFSPFAADIHYTSTPGPINMDLASTPFTRIERPAWPLDQPPFDAYGKTWA